MVGDRHAMIASEQLFEHLLQHREAFLAFVRKRVPDPDVAADVLQDSLLKALKNAAQIRDDENVVAWFYRILRHSLIDLYRRRAVRDRALQDLQLELEHAPTPEEKRSLCACLQALLPTLKPEYAELVRTVDLGEEPVDAAARRLGITPTTSMSASTALADSFTPAFLKAAGCAPGTAVSIVTALVQQPIPDEAPPAATSQTQPQSQPLLVRLARNSAFGRRPAVAKVSP